MWQTSILNCVPLFDAPPLTKNRNNFLAIGPFFMFLGAFERHGHAAHYDFNFITKYIFLKKLEPKIVCCSFSITHFLDFFRTIFSENFQKWFFKNVKISKNSKFEKCSTLKKHFQKNIIFWKQLNSIVFRNFFFGKILFWKSKKFHISKKISRFHIFEKQFLEIFRKHISKKYFLKNELWKNCNKQFSALTFWKINIFWWN